MMKFEYRSYLPGGKVKVEVSGEEGFTCGVKINDMLLAANDPEDVGSLSVMWASSVIRREVLKVSERFVPSFDFEDAVEMGGRRKVLKFGSPLDYLDEWATRRDLVIEYEKALMMSPQGLAMEFMDACQLLSSLAWFIQVSGCQPRGLKQELEDGGFDFQKSWKEGDDAEKSIEGLSPEDARAVKAYESLKSDKGGIQTVLGTVLGDSSGSSVFSGDEIDAADGFKPDQRKMLRRLQTLMMPMAQELPVIKGRFFDKVSDAELGSAVVQIFSDVMRLSFPDPFVSRQNMEDAKAKRVKAAKKKT